MAWLAESDTDRCILPEVGWAVSLAGIRCPRRDRLHCVTRRAVLTLSVQ
jgi:hypothetical protein